MSDCSMLRPMLKLASGALCFAVCLLPGCGDDSDGAGGSGPSTSSGQGGSAGQGGSVGCPADLPEALSFDHDAEAGRFRIENDPAGSELGTFDPSFVRAADGSYAVSYTGVNLSRNLLNTRIGVSTDGSNFEFVAAANAAEVNVEVDAVGDPDCPGGTCSNATVIHEVSGLVEDVSDPDASARWKLFTHSYVVLEPDPGDPLTPRLRYTYGHIRSSSAPSPAGPWSEPAPMIGWPSAAPLSSQAPVLVTDIAGVEDCLMLTEPSAAIDSGTGAIELAVGCLTLEGSTPTIRIELLRSADHGATWIRANRLLDGADASCLGAPNPELNAPHLFTRGGQRYLIATPSGNVTVPGGGSVSGYRGCWVFRRTDDGVERDEQGAPIVVAHIDPGEGVFAGACSHHPLGGYVVSALSFASPPVVFRMFGPLGEQLP